MFVFCSKLTSRDDKSAHFSNLFPFPQDGRVDYNEFVAMMQNGNDGFGKKGMQTTFSMGFREALKLD